MRGAPFALHTIDGELVADDGLEFAGLGGRAGCGADALEPEPVEGVAGDGDLEGDAGPVFERENAVGGLAM